MASPCVDAPALDRGPPLAKAGNLGSIPSRGTKTESGTADTVK